MPVDSVCPECATPIHASTPLAARPASDLRRFRNAMLFLLIAAPIAALCPWMWDVAIEQLVPPSMNPYEIPRGTRAAIIPWFPWRFQLGTLATHALAIVALWAAWRFFAAAESLGLSAAPRLRAAKGATIVAMLTLGTWVVISLLAWPQPIGRTVQVGYALAGVNLLLCCMVAVASVVLVRRGWIAAAKPARRKVVSWILVAGVPLVVARLADHGLLLTWGLVSPTQPAPFVVPLMPFPAEDYLVLDRYGGATRTTTASAEDIERSMAYQNAVRSRSFGLAAFAFAIRRWVTWPLIGVGFAAWFMLGWLWWFVRSAMVRGAEPRSTEAEE